MLMVLQMSVPAVPRLCRALEDTSFIVLFANYHFFHGKPRACYLHNDLLTDLVEEKGILKFYLV